MTDTTLMMVTYNRLDLTKRTINCLWNTGRLFNLVVVDNGSTDGTPEYLVNLKLEAEAEVNNDHDCLAPYPTISHVELILLPENKGIAVGRNLALKKADELKTQWYCTIDNDVECPEGWLEECVKILKANKTFGALGVNMEERPYPLITKSGYTFQEKPRGNLGTACMVFRKQLHQMIGFFTTEYGLYGEEDSDFGMRSQVAGFKLGYIERMGTHLGADESEKNSYREFKTKQHADNLSLFKQNCAKYYQRTKPLYIPFKDHH